MKKRDVILELKAAGRGRAVDPKAIEYALKRVERYKDKVTAYWMGFSTCFLIYLLLKIMDIFLA